MAAEMKKTKSEKQRKKRNGEEEVEEGSGAGWVSLFYLKLTKDIFVHSLKVLGAPAIMQGAPSNTQIWNLKAYVK